MLSKRESRKKIGENSGAGKLLDDIESISKALYLDKAQPRLLMSTVSSRSKSVGKPDLPEPKSKSKEVNKDLLEKDSKKSIWSWKGIKALANVRNRTFNCCFSLHVHSVEGLPVLFDSSSLVVHWKRRDGEMMTHPVRVLQGVAEFEERLTYSCSVHGSRNGPHHSAKYDAKHFLLYVSVYGAPEMDLGKHRVDLARLLPLTLEELEDEKSSGKWTTSYRLSGKAKGATLNVSFGYYVLHGNDSTSKDVCEKQATERRPRSIPAISGSSSWPTEDIKDLHEVCVSKSDLSKSVNVVYRKLDEEKIDASANGKQENGFTPNDDMESLKPDSKGNSENECETGEFFVMDQGLEISLKEQEKPEILAIDSVEGCVESDDVLEIPAELLESDLGLEVQMKCTKKSIMEELDSALAIVSKLENEGSHSQDNNEISNLDNYLGIIQENDDKLLKKGKSHSLDDMTESVATEFLDMLGIEHSPFGFSSESEPESPRERLLRQFEKEALDTGCSLFNCGEIDTGNTSGDFGFFSATNSYVEVLPKIETNETRNRTNASMLEDLETEVLMHEWGLNERAFHHSPPKSSSGFGSPIDVEAPEDLNGLPPLGEGLGPFLHTKDGGFLRSMNPALFKKAKSGGKLSMQVSKPVVVPAEMGSGVMDILQHLAAIGIEKLSMQANKLMPLEDITGKTVQQIAWEAASSLEGSERLSECEVRQNMSSFPDAIRGNLHEYEPNTIGNKVDTEYLSLEDVAPLATDKIESLLIEGLRIQSDMSNEDAPSNLTPQPAFEGMVSLGGPTGLEGAGGLHLLDMKNACEDGNDNDVDGLMGLSLSLDEWMRLDSGEVYDDDEISERTSKLLAAHHANSMDLIRGGSKGRGKGRKKSFGLLSNNFTVALMVQLRDPLRDYEPVGRPMLALVQVEREFLPPKPRIYCSVSELRSNNGDGDDGEKLEGEEECGSVKKEETVVTEQEEQNIPQYKITEVHVAGLNTEECNNNNNNNNKTTTKKKLWGTTTQQQSGSRWLLANGMGKKNKHPLMKTKAGGGGSRAAALPPASTTVQPGETLWSVSSRVYGSGSKWKEIAALNPHIRNPNVIFPGKTVRLI
ncbi:hypothetical protein DM860_005490 [Cuscuta australis]|uniref:LysM domain-containing protein n=1 Tax=Cuscuta australis TaxID=267555 RepID=A0A328DZH0_9ASTE|nr:hypothetical protein DM860_005490 [Cuscuta australis]